MAMDTGRDILKLQNLQDNVQQCSARRITEEFCNGTCTSATGAKFDCWDLNKTGQGESATASAQASGILEGFASGLRELDFVATELRLRSPAKSDLPGCIHLLEFYRGRLKEACDAVVEHVNVRMQECFNSQPWLENATQCFKSYAADTDLPMPMSTCYANLLCKLVKLHLHKRNPLDAEIALWNLDSHLAATANDWTSPTETHARYLFLAANLLSLHLHRGSVKFIGGRGEARKAAARLYQATHLLAHKLNSNPSDSTPLLRDIESDALAKHLQLMQFQMKRGGNWQVGGRLPTDTEVFDCVFSTKVGSASRSAIGPLLRSVDAIGGWLPESAESVTAKIVELSKPPPGAVLDVNKIAAPFTEQKDVVSVPNVDSDSEKLSKRIEHVSLSDDVRLKSELGCSAVIEERMLGGMLVADQRQIQYPFLRKQKQQQVRTNHSSLHINPSVPALSQRIDTRFAPCFSDFTVEPAAKGQLELLNVAADGRQAKASSSRQFDASSIAIRIPRISFSDGTISALLEYLATNCQDASNEFMGIAYRALTATANYQTLDIPPYQIVQLMQSAQLPTIVKNCAAIGGNATLHEVGRTSRQAFTDPITRRRLPASCLAQCNLGNADTVSCSMNARLWSLATGLLRLRHDMIPSSF